MSITIDSILSGGNNYDGEIPEFRVKDADSANQLISLYLQNDSERAELRARARGMLDGNAPYDAKKLKELNQSNRANINFRQMEADLNNALSPFYDIFSEVTSFAEITTIIGDSPNESKRYSDEITYEFTELLKNWKGFDYYVQLKQRNMVFFGTGPVIWPDDEDWRFQSIQVNQLQVPDDAESNIDNWESCAIIQDVTPIFLYKFIKNEEAAREAGWNVEEVKNTIKNSCSGIVNIPDKGNQWEYYQNLIRNNSLFAQQKSKKIRIGHLFVQEFDGKISHYITDRSFPGSKGKNKSLERDFLFKRQGRYGQWRNFVQPFYFDYGTGDHHSVKGLAVKTFPFRDLQNKLRCTIADSAFAGSAILLQSTTPEADEEMNAIQMGPYTRVPYGVQIVQNTIGGVIDGPMAVDRMLEGNLGSNIAQYNTNARDNSGQPITATQADYDASKEGKLTKSDLNRYFTQLDDLYEEMYRRIVKIIIAWTEHDALAKADPAVARFMKNLTKKKVPRDAIINIESVRATRNVGQGSPYFRRQIYGQILGVISLFPPSVREQVAKDYLTALVGQENIYRFYPLGSDVPVNTNEDSLISLEDAVMHIGQSPVVVDTQNHVLHVENHLGAAGKLIKDIDAGGSPMALLQFWEGAGPHIQAHMIVLQGNPAFKAEFAELQQGYLGMVKIVQQLQAQIQQQMEAQQAAEAEQQEAVAGQDKDFTLAVRKQDMDHQLAQRKLALKEQTNQKQNAQRMTNKQRDANQKLAIKDVETAQKIRSADATTRVASKSAKPKSGAGTKK